MNERLEGEGLSEETPPPSNPPPSHPKDSRLVGRLTSRSSSGQQFLGKQYGGKFNLFAVFFEMSRFMGKWKCVAFFIAHKARKSPPLWLLPEDGAPSTGGIARPPAR